MGKGIDRFAEELSKDELDYLGTIDIKKYIYEKNGTLYTRDPGDFPVPNEVVQAVNAKILPPFERKTGGPVVTTLAPPAQKAMTGIQEHLIEPGAAWFASPVLKPVLTHPVSPSTYQPMGGIMGPPDPRDPDYQRKALQYMIQGEQQGGPLPVKTPMVEQYRSQKMPWGVKGALETLVTLPVPAAGARGPGLRASKGLVPRIAGQALRPMEAVEAGMGKVMEAPFRGGAKVVKKVFGKPQSALETRTVGMPEGLRVKAENVREGIGGSLPVDSASIKAEIESIEDYLSTDPVAKYRGHVGGSTRTLTNFMRTGDLPETITVKEAKMLLMKPDTAYISPSAMKGDRVRWDYVADQMAEHFGMSGNEFNRQLERVVQYQRRLSALKNELGFALEEEVEKLPLAMAGTPEAGVQKGMFGVNKPVTPKGAPVKQASLDAFAKMQEMKTITPEVTTFYHGSPQIGLKEIKASSGDWGEGVYFTTDKTVASQYSMGRGNLRKFVLGDTVTEPQVGIVYRVDIKLKNPLKIKTNEEWQRYLEEGTKLTGNEDDKSLARWARKQGYDGIINDVNKEGIAFNLELAPVKPETPKVTQPLATTGTVSVGGTVPPAQPPVMPPTAPTKPPVPPVQTVPIAPVSPQFRRIKLPELADLEQAIDDQFGYMTGKLTNLTKRAADKLEALGGANPFRQVNPSVLADDAHRKALYTYAGIKQSGTSGANYVGSVLRSRYGNAVKTMGVDDAGRCLGIQGNPYIADVMTWPEQFALTPAQREFTDVVNDVLQQRLGKLTSKNIPIRALNLIEEATGKVYGIELTEGRYFPRIIQGYRGGTERKWGAVGGRVKAKPAQVKTRGWPTMKQGVEEGNIQYLVDPIETIEKTLQGAYKLEADYGLVDYIGGLPGVRTIKGTLLAEQAPLLQRRANTANSWKVFTDGREALNEVRASKTGTTINAQRLDKIRRYHPQLADDIEQTLKWKQYKGTLPAGVTKQWDAITQRVKALENKLQLDLKDVSIRYSKAKKAAANLREGEGAVLNQYAFNGTIMPDNIANDLSNYLNDKGITLNRWVTELNHAAIGLQTTVDFGFTLIQGLLLATRHPALWAENFGRALQILASPKSYGKFLEQHAATVQKMVTERSAPLSGSEFTQFMRTGPISKVPGLRNVFSRFTGMFDAWIDMGRVSLHEAMEASAIHNSGNAMRDLSDHVDKMFGVISSEKLGLSATRRQLESAWILYAPRYRRAVFGFIADAMQGGWRGREAQKAIAALATGTAAIYTATCLALDQEPNFDPRTGKFMTIKIGNSHIGAGTPFVGLVRLGGNIWKAADENPEGFISFDSRDNPFLKFSRSQISPVAGALWDAADGKTFVGEQVNRELANVGREVAEYVLPFWAAEYATSALKGENVPGPELAAGEFTGMRAWPYSISEERTEARNEAAQKAYGADYYDTKCPPEKRLTWLQRNELERKNPDLQKLNEQVYQRGQGTDAPMEAKYDLIKHEADKNEYEKLEEAANLILTGEKKIGDWFLMKYGIQKFTSGAKWGANFLKSEADQKDFEKWLEKVTHPWDKQVNKYFDLDTTAKREAFLASLPSLARAYVQAYLEDDKKDWGEKAQQVETMSKMKTTTRGGTFPPINIPVLR